ncbi:MAG: hypothetical protein KF715_10820 [Candidatus Didemnitutus sp.]|nr:hypothetical protein [Candidatus Didemnitutus sp.]
MPARDEAPSPALARLVARHSYGWLVAANLVGVWLAIALVWPAAGDALVPLTYGRWVPLHLDWQLYGWCSLPIVGALLAWCSAPADGRALAPARLALTGWSLVLALGGLTWLGGGVSGKLFLDWAGSARPLLPAAMLVLWGVLARLTAGAWNGFSPAGRALRALVLAALLPVPAVLFWSTGREVYPAVNPDSGGATGAALLGSTLGIVAIFLLLPHLLRLAPRGAAVWRGAVIGMLGASGLAFAAIDHGNTSHHAFAQIVALGLLGLWIPLLGVYWRGFDWPPAARAWMAAALAWWALLIVSGWVTFLPGVSEALKFTHGLVGHAHLAMAGVVTSVNGMILAALTRQAVDRGSFWRWHAGCGVYVVATLVLGALETERSGELFRSANWTQALLGLRLIGGLSMLDASGRWLRDAWKP